MRHGSGNALTYLLKHGAQVLVGFFYFIQNSQSTVSLFPNDFTTIVAGRLGVVNLYIA